MALPTPNEGGDIRKNWRFIKAQAAEIDRLKAQLATLARNLADLALRVGDTNPGLHPFKIYQVPAIFRATAAADDWRKVRVRSGRIGPLDENDITGTDAADNPDMETYPNAVDITVPEATARYWIWIELETDWSGAAVMHGADPSANGWENFPEATGRHFPVGWVDSATQAANKELSIRQILRGDVLSRGSTFMNFRGAYDDEEDYKLGDVVYTPLSEDPDDNAVSICLQDDPGALNPPWNGSPYWFTLTKTNTVGKWL